jgi:hypothetical protein
MLLEKTLEFISEILNGRLRKYDDSYVIDIFRGNMRYYSITFTLEGVFDGIEEFKIKKRRTRPNN